MPALVESCAMSTVVWRMIASINSFTSMGGNATPVEEREGDA
jgi:hypothetical protein